MILTEPLNVREVQDLHAAYHILEQERETLLDQDRTNELQRENESLRKMLNNSIDDATALAKKNERLREFLDYGDPAAMRQHIPKLEAEVERLREELDDKRLSRYEPAYVDELEQKVESLRDANISIRRDLQTSWEEKARLREENERLRAAQAEAWDEVEVQHREVEKLRKRADELEDLPPKTWREEWNKQQDEVERLREENERLRERGDWAVEQLRLAEAAGEELREQLSLNRVHDRDCVAREAELIRLREEKAGLWRDRESFVEREVHLREENERLRGRVAMAESALKQSNKLLSMQTAEVERLRATEVERDRAREALAMRVEASKTDMAELRRQVDAIRAGNERIAELEAANERLRKRADELEDLPPKTWREAWNKQQDEVERLREENDALIQNEDRLRHSEEALVEMVRCFGGLDKSKMYAAALEQARAVLANQPTEGRVRVPSWTPAEEGDEVGQ